MPIFPRDWFTNTVVERGVAGPTPEKGAALAAAAAPVSTETKNVGALVSAQSLTTFGGITFAVGVVWGGIERFTGSHQLWIGAALSGIAGLLLLIDDLRDPQRAAVPGTPMRVFAAVVNTFVIFGAASSAVGVASAGASAAPGTPPATIAK